MMFDKNLLVCDKLIVLFRTGVKFIRGIFVRPFLKKASGIFLVGKKVDITHAKHIICGKDVKFEDYAEIHGLCSEGIILGDHVTIGRGTMIRPSSYYGVSVGRGLKMGNYSSIGPHGYIGCSGGITIGSNVMFGPKCSLFAENHIFGDINNTIASQGVSQKGIVVEDDCWIGSGVIILDGVKVGKGSVIGAGTLVNKDIPPYSIVVNKRELNIRNRNKESKI